MRKGRFFAVGAACAAVLLAAGCGGGGGVDEVTASSISKGEYVKKASAICEEAAKRIKTDFGVYVRQQEDEKATDKTAGYAELIAKVFAPNVEQEVDELRELGAPKADVNTVEAMLKAREEALASIEKNPLSAVSNKPFEKSIKAAEDYGLPACAVP